MKKSKLTKEDKIKRKQYWKDFKKIKKELIQFIKKDYGPWDNPLIPIFPIIIDHWKKYYSLGYNVWGMEICDDPDRMQPDHPTRYQIACELERRYNAWRDFTGIEEVREEDGVHKLVYIKEFCDEEGKPIYELVSQENARLKQEFFDYYITYAEEMWD